MSVRSANSLNYWNAAFSAQLCVALKLVHFGKWIRNSWEVLKCGAGEVWRSSFGPNVWEIKNYNKE
jgi:hypothetical protein